MGRALKQNGRAAKRDGKAATVDCAECCEPIPGEPWVKAVPCDCSSSDETEAWIRSSDYLALRAQGSCPTGKLPDGSCWEILPGAETRSTDPPIPQQLTPFGVGGCCVCCPGCEKTDVFFPQQVGCAAATYEIMPACCALGDTVAVSGYQQLETFVLSDGDCGTAGEGLARFEQAWWSCDATGCRGFVRRRLWDFVRTGCPLDRDETFEPTRFAAGCTEAFVALDPATLQWGNGTAGFPIECGTCGPIATGTGTSGPRGAQWDLSNYREKVPATGECVRAQRLRGTLVRAPLAGGVCAGQCRPTILAPDTPPLPSGGNLDLILPGASGTGGCANCGGDGGL